MVYSLEDNQAFLESGSKRRSCIDDISKCQLAGQKQIQQVFLFVNRIGFVFEVRNHWAAEVNGILGGLRDFSVGDQTFKQQLQYVWVYNGLAILWHPQRVEVLEPFQPHVLLGSHDVSFFFLCYFFILKNNIGNLNRFSKCMPFFFYFFYFIVSRDLLCVVYTIDKTIKMVLDVNRLAYGITCVMLFGYVLNCCVLCVCELGWVVFLLLLFCLFLSMLF